MKMRQSENETSEYGLDPNMSCLDFPSKIFPSTEERKYLNRFVWYLLTYECVCNEKLLALKFVKFDHHLLTYLLLLY